MLPSDSSVTQKTGTFIHCWFNMVPNIPQGSVATRLRCGGTLSDDFVINLPPRLDHSARNLKIGPALDETSVASFFTQYGQLSGVFVPLVCTAGVCCAVGSLVDHDFAEHGAEQSTESVGEAVSLNVHVSRCEWSPALDVKSPLEQRVVESTDEAAHGRLAQSLFAGPVVGVDRQFVEVVHVITEVHTLGCINNDDHSIIITFDTRS